MLSKSMNEKFNHIMDFIQTNINPKQINENTQNITSIHKQLRIIHQRLDQICTEKNLNEMESINDQILLDSDDNMDESSQEFGHNPEQSEVKCRKNDPFYNDFPPLIEREPTDNHEFIKRC